MNNSEVYDIDELYIRCIQRIIGIDLEMRLNVPLPVTALEVWNEIDNIIPHGLEPEDFEALLERERSGQLKVYAALAEERIRNER